MDLEQNMVGGVKWGSRRDKERTGQEEERRGGRWRELD